MNLQKLQKAETIFLSKYPTGFYHPALMELGKKHKMDKMISLTQESFSKRRFSRGEYLAEDIVKIVGHSSMISMFEKPKFKNFIFSLSENERQKFIYALKQFLHGKQEKGFNTMVEILKTGKLAKWSLVTILPNYYHPDEEVFVKPTTAKSIIAHFELENLEYKPTPTWAFYQRYKNTILEMKTNIDESLAPNNAAFCGFLMMSFES